MSAAAAVKERQDVLQQKSFMLDEVNQLLDLMVGEKDILQKRIQELESEVNVQYQLKENNIQQQATETPVHNIDEIIQYIHKERQIIKQLNQKINDIKHTLHIKQHNSIEEIKKHKTEINQLQLTGREHKRQIKKLTEETVQYRYKYEQLLNDVKKKEKELENITNKYHKSRTSLLAIKSKTKLQLKRKDQDIKRQEKENVSTIEERIKLALQANLTDKDREIQHLTITLQTKENDIDTLVQQLATVKENVTQQLSDLEAELQSSRTELNELNSVLKTQNEELMKTKQMLKHERRQSHVLLTSSQGNLTRLLSQIDRERNEHQKELHTLRVAMATQRQEDKLQLDRLREVSIKRCGQLAKEVWSLKINK